MKTCLSCQKQVDDLMQVCPNCGNGSFASTGNDTLSTLEAMQKRAEASKHVDAGAQLLRHGRYDEAESELKKAIEINPLNATAHGNLGGVFLFQGKPEEAIPWFEKALKINPRLEGVPEALEQARTAVKNKPASPRNAPPSAETNQTMPRKQWWQLWK